MLRLLLIQPGKTYRLVKIWGKLSYLALAVLLGTMVFQARPRQQTSQRLCGICLEKDGDLFAPLAGLLSMGLILVEQENAPASDRDRYRKREYYVL